MHISLAKLHDRIQLRNTTVFYLSPNITSKLQPCDVGIIRSLKAYYLCSFYRLFLQQMDNKASDLDKIGILKAIRLTVPAWRDKAEPTTIANCFRHCRI